MKFFSRSATSEDLYLHREQTQPALEIEWKGEKKQKGQAEKKLQTTALWKRGVCRRNAGNNRETRPLMEHSRLWLKKDQRTTSISLFLFSLCSNSHPASPSYSPVFFFPTFMWSRKSEQRGGARVWGCARCERKRFMSRWWAGSSDDVSKHHAFTVTASGGAEQRGERMVVKERIGGRGRK